MLFRKRNEPLRYFDWNEDEGLQYLSFAFIVIYMWNLDDYTGDTHEKAGTIWYFNAGYGGVVI